MKGSRKWHNINTFGRAVMKRYNLKTKEGKNLYLKDVYLKGDHGVNFFEQKTRSIMEQMDDFKK